jgi:hypothetical protein
MLLYHYSDPNRSLVTGGYWFDYGGKLRDTAPQHIAEMRYIPNWDVDYICCCYTMSDVLIYFPKTVHAELNGVYGIYEYNGRLITQIEELQQADCTMEYVTADANKLKLVDQMGYDDAVKTRARYKAVV